MGLSGGIRPEVVALVSLCSVNIDSFMQLIKYSFQVESSNLNAKSLASVA